MTGASEAGTTTRHYEELLADVYDWMQGGWDEKTEFNRQVFDQLGLNPSAAGAQAVDLGAGTGYQSIPLAELGYSVVAIDASAAMLDQLRARATGPLAAAITTAVGDAASFAGHVSRSVELIVCMGDTLSHLASHEAVVRLVNAMAESQSEGGRLVLSFRDGANPASGDERFIPIKSDADRIFTCFVEELDENRLKIHDLLHVRSDNGFSQQLSSYEKIRIRTDWLGEQLVTAGYQPPTVAVDKGMTLITTAR